MDSFLTPCPAVARSLLPNGETDNNSLHGSCPTLKGEKWSATKWIHVGPFGGTSELQRAKWCARIPSASDRPPHSLTGTCVGALCGYPWRNRKAAACHP